ncbi:MORN repeat-containing protein 1 isoform X4 [Erinaceus europaeus]|uniref:MORN repeat-containing protein 1 isoform X4 n=1 Tax=Erinaceus europaeus TaxID=9365 RepID=A0ABM3Y488_ERIEU|nr:MORN repeat-containing protein 1 isoform X4 [Erinaceus europaeus]
METSGHNMAAASSEVSPGSRLQRRDRRGRPPSDGYGVYIYPNSFFQYEGEWKGGKKHGHGKLLFKDGSYYEGEFVHGEITGEGCRYWASSGNTYSGHFVLGEPQGHGMMKYKAGGYYEGELSHGMREGLGCLVDQDGQTYKGWFHNHRRHGRGQMTFQNGDKYEGDWVRDQRQGHGVLHQVDGSTYEVAGHLYSSSTCQCCSLPFSTLFSSQGQWHGDVFSGLGTLTHCSGVTYHGLWVNGHPVAQATRMVILGPEVLAVAPGAAFTLMVQLQQANGAVAEVGLSASPILCGAPHLGVWSLELPSKEPPLSHPWMTWRQHLSPGVLRATPSAACLLEGRNPTACNTVSRRNTAMSSLRMSAWDPLHCGTTPSHSSAPPSRPSSMMASPGLVTAALPGEYVIMVHDVTTPPFLGHTLPTAFQHLRVTAQGGQSQPSQPPRGGPEAPGKGPDTSGKSSEPFGEGPDVPR